MKKVNPIRRDKLKIILSGIAFLILSGCFVSAPLTDTKENTAIETKHARGTLAVKAVTTIIDTNVTVNAGTVTRIIPEELFGCNIAAWNGSTDGKHPIMNDYMKISGMKVIRYPGGSWADILAWDTVGTASSNSWQLDNNESIAFAQASGATLQAIINFSGYWDGVQHSDAETIQKAVDWVRYMNFTRGFPIKYWEIGNETLGSWEQGYTNGSAYGSKFADFYKAMKAVDPTIQIGATATTVDNGDSWTGYNWWNRDMFASMLAKGVTPDFLIIHTYPTSDPGMNPANDAKILQAPDTIAEITSNLDQMISKYIGPSFVGKIKYNMTEYRSVLGSYPQLITCVDALFTAQYIMEMAKYGWAGANIWNIRNGWDTSYNGDYGIFYIDKDAPRPTYYAIQLLSSKFGRNMVQASVSSNSIIKAYASKDASGNLTLLLINNSPDTDLTAQVSINGFNPSSTAEKWVLEPSGAAANGSTTLVQEFTNIALNGAVNPDAPTTYYMPGTPIPAGANMAVPVKKSTIVLVRIGSGNNSSSSSSISSMSFASSSSRPSVVSTIPGTVEAEDYTNMSGVQAEDCVEGGQDIGWINYGDWCDYTVDVQSSGLYTVEYRVAGVGSTGTIQLLSGGQWLNEVTIPSTGDWQTWTSITASVNLNAGKQTMRLFFNGTGFNINYAKFTKAGASSSSTGVSSSKQTTSSSSLSSSSIISSRSSSSLSSASSKSSVSSKSSISSMSSASSVVSSRSSVSSAVSSSGSSSSAGQYADKTAPFVYDGAGEYYWRMSNIPNFINCWNLTALEINGVSFLNKWASPSQLPAKQDGYYYIHYKGPYPWSHFEAK